jgi:SAM-dependent methyltransferase
MSQSTALHSAPPEIARAAQSPDAALLLRFIERNLPDMATSFDEGLGIASERYSVNKALLRFAATHLRDRPIERALEAPADGLMGIPGMNSVVLARELGADVVVGSPSQALLSNAAPFWERLGLHDKVQFDVIDERFPYPDRSFDWVWNYCTFEHFNDAGALLREMKRVSRRYVCVVTQNAYNYGYPIHLLYHAWHRQPWDHGYSRWMKMGNLMRLFQQCGLRVVERGCVDVPPWFDTFDMHTRGKIKKYMSKDGAQKWDWSSLQPDDMQKLAANALIRKLERFESWLFFPLSYVFAHHFYVIGEIAP